jgi:hypothetical protein
MALHRFPRGGSSPQVGRAAAVSDWLAGSESSSAGDTLDDAVFAKVGIGSRTWSMTIRTMTIRKTSSSIPPYDRQVSVLDVRFMKRPAATNYLWGHAVAAPGSRP